MIYIFTGASLIINFFIILFAPIKLSRREIYLTWIFVALVVLWSDLFLGDILDLYDLMDPGPQPYDLFIQTTLPATFGILYLNFMPKDKKRYIFYLLFWVIFSVFYELLSSFYGYVVYKGWKPWWSIIYYFFACLVTRWHFYFCKNRKN
jgi:hypothetical protein